MGKAGVDRLRTPWRVRVRDTGGRRVLGAGMLLGTSHVLTCAHVITSAGGYRHDPDEAVPDKAVPDADLVVDFVGLPDAPSARARVTRGCWAPPLAGDWGDRGDVALLTLEQPQPDGCGAPLHRMPVTPDSAVRAYGFPEHLDNGLWARAKLAGDCGERVQLNAIADAPQVRAGFSGAGVIDDGTGYVIGMVVTEYRVGETTDRASVSWMLPVETIIRYVPKVARWVSGDRAVDESFTKRIDSQVSDVGFAEDCTGWLAQRGTGWVRVIVTGESDSARSTALRFVVALADRERSTNTDEVIAEVPRGVVPPVGSVDLAVDASGRTAEEVARRIVDRMGIPLQEGTSLFDRVRDAAPPMTLVVDAIDDAAEPDVLLNELLIPLAKQARARGIRLILAFCQESSPGVGTVLSTLDETETAEDDISERLERLAERVAELGAAEEEIRHIAARFTAVRDISAHAAYPGLRLELSALRMAACDRDRDRDRILRRLPRCERAVERALALARDNRARFDGLLSRRQELRGRLEVYKNRAADHRVVEDIELAERYRPARDSLWEAPCDLSVAEEAVERYIRVVRRKLGGGSGEVPE